MNKIIEDSPIPYLNSLEQLKANHPQIDTKLKEYIRILKESITHKMQIILNINHHYGIIQRERTEEELKDVYDGIDILSTHLPNYEREQKNWNTLQQKEINLLVSCIIDLISIINGDDKDWEKKTPKKSVKSVEQK